MRAGCRAAARAGVLTALAVVLAACPVPDRPSTSVGHPAPDYQAVTLEGEPVSLADYRGQVVLLNVWATWCAPCRVEIPELQELQDRLGERGLRVVGVSVDGSGTQERVRRFQREVGMSYESLFDPQDRVSPTFDVFGVPATFLIDREGVIRWRHLGPLTADQPDLVEALEDALGT